MMRKTGRRSMEEGKHAIANPDGLRTQLGLDLEEALLELSAGLRGEVDLDVYEVAERSASAETSARRSTRSPK
jgi:hypothetical protein